MSRPEHGHKLNPAFHSPRVTTLPKRHVAYGGSDGFSHPCPQPTNMEQAPHLTFGGRYSLLGSRSGLYSLDTLGPVDAQCINGIIQSRSDKR